MIRWQQISQVVVVLSYFYSFIIVVNYFYSLLL